MKRFFLVSLLMMFGFFASIGSLKAQEEPHWTFSTTTYEAYNSFNSVISIDGVVQTNANLELGAFCGDECRGTFFPPTVYDLPPAMGGTKYMYHLPIWGQEGDVISFKVYDHANSTEMAISCSTITWTAGDDQGDLLTPYIFAFASATTYDVTVTVNPTTAGTVTGAGTYVEGETCTLTATANSGYAFLNWTVGGSPVSTDATYSFTVNADTDVVANFEATAYIITVSINPETAGSVSGGGSFNYGETCTLSYTLPEGHDQYFTFAMWTDEDGNVVSFDDDYVFTVTESGNYIAEFSYDEFMITTFAYPSMGGTATVNKNNFIPFETATLTATPAAGWVFEKWMIDDPTTGAMVSTEAEYVIEHVTGNNAGNYFAIFSQPEEFYTITATADPVEGGVVDGGGEYGSGSMCTLTATPTDGYDFLYWTVDGNTFTGNEEMEITFAVTANAEYVAHFEQHTYMITTSVNPAGAGTAEGAGGYTYGQTVSLVATANDGYVFTNWTLNGVEVSTDAIYTFDVVDNAQAGNYVANFEEGCHISIVVTGGAGTVSGSGTYSIGDVVTIEYTPADDCEVFDYFLIGGTQYTDNPYYYTITSTDDVEVDVMVHTAGPFNIVVYSYETQNGTVSGGGTFYCGDECTVVAVPGDGWVFINWTLNGEPVSTDLVYSFTVEGSATYVANFVEGLMVTAECQPDFAGTIVGTGVYGAGETCTLTVTETDPTHYQFAWWSVDGNVVSMDYTYSFTVTESVNVVAEFIYDEFTVTTSSNQSYAGTTEGGGTFLWNEECTISAVANPSTDPSYYFQFVNWTLNGVEVSTDAEYTFNVTEAGDYVANFDQVLYDYMVNVEINGVVETYYVNAGDQLTIEATPEEGYHFVNWTDNGAFLSAQNPYTFQVFGDMNIVANFALNLYYVHVDVDPNATYGYVEGYIPGGYYLHGHQCILHAVANAGYSFDYWTKDGVVVSYDEDYRFVVTDETFMVAHFSRETYYITATVNPYGAGTVTGTGSFNYGASCTLVATANSGYTFLNWSKGGEVVSTTASYNFTVEESAQYVANFTQNTYTITVAANPEEAAYVFIQNGQNGQFVYGESCTLRVATPNPGYHFINWTLNGTVVSTDPTYTFTVTGNANFVANFYIDTYVITASATPTIGGTVSGAGEFNYGESCTLTATPRNGYTFLRWTKNGAVVSTDANFTFTVHETAHYVAQFTSRNIHIAASISIREEGGVIIGAGDYEEGETVTMNVIPNEGYVFVEWLEDGKPLTTEQQFSFVAEYDRTFVAVLRQYTDVEENNNVTVTVYPNPAVNELTVETDQAEYQLDIFTITGALVRTINNCSNNTRIDVQDLTSGSYIIRLTNGNVVETRRFVKK